MTEGCEEEHCSARSLPAVAVFWIYLELAQPQSCKDALLPVPGWVAAQRLLSTTCLTLGKLNAGAVRNTKGERSLCSAAVTVWRYRVWRGPEKKTQTELQTHNKGASFYNADRGKGDLLSIKSQR